MSIWKRIRKLLRGHKGLLILGSLLLILLAGMMLKNTFWVEEVEEQVEEDQAIGVMVSQPVSLILETNYLCGTEREYSMFDNAAELESWFAEQDKAWQLQEKTDQHYLYTRSVDNDLSPVCKEEGYFGLSGDSVLTIFQGPPSSNQIIETFFRLDTQLLEVRLPKDEWNHLQQGIRFQNVAEYLSILSTFADYATN